MLQGPNPDRVIRSLRDQSSFVFSRPVYNYLELKGIESDVYLDLFVHMMRYIYPCIPTNEGVANAGGWLFVPFTIDAVYLPDQLHDLCSQTTLAWPEVYKTHPSWANEDNKAKLTLVVRGNTTFFITLARHCWPLGKLANNNAFNNHPENL